MSLKLGGRCEIRRFTVPVGLGRSLCPARGRFLGRNGVRRSLIGPPGFRGVRSRWSLDGSSVPGPGGGGVLGGVATAAPPIPLSSCSSLAGGGVTEASKAWAWCRIEVGIGVVGGWLSGPGCVLQGGVVGPVIGCIALMVGAICMSDVVVGVATAASALVAVVIVLGTVWDDGRVAVSSTVLD